MKAPKRAAACGAILALIAITGAADDDPVAQGQWYVSPMASMVFDDSERLTDPGPGVHLGVGKRVSEHFLLEFNAVGDWLNGFADYDQWGVGVDLLAIGGRGGAVVPYGVFGVGYLDTHVAAPPGRNIADTSNFMGAMGLGVMVPLGGGGATFRSDIRVRNDFAKDSLTDFVFNAGLLFPVGSGDATALLPDTDHDGVPDERDVCAGTPPGSAVDEHGCEFDTDGDGVIDRRDKCPDTRRGAPVNADGCEVAADSDGDGVPDDRDVCPGTPRGTPVGANGCELDGDRDGVLDVNDQCPNTASGARVDFRGCAIKEEISLPGVNFEFNSARLKPESLSVLNQAAGTLERYPEIKAECSGHTDALGPDAYNLKLSQQRAEAVCEYLLSRGVTPSRLTARGYGEARPIADNSTPEGQSLNRRVTLRIVN